MWVLRFRNVIVPSHLFFTSSLIHQFSWQLESESVSCSVVSLCDPMYCSLPRSSVHGILQARILELLCYFSLQEIFPTQDGTGIWMDLEPRSSQLRSAALQADSLPSEHQGLWPCFKWFACISHSKQEVLTSCYGRLRIHIICSIPSPFPFLHPPIFVSHTSVCACACVCVICLFLGLFCLEDSSGRRQVRVAACPSSLQGRILMLEALTFSRKITYISSRIVSCPLT